MSELNTLLVLLGLVGMVSFIVYGLRHHRPRLHYRPVKRTDKDLLMFELHGLLSEKTGCHSARTGWCCNFCFHGMALGVSNKRLHELWLSTLVISGGHSRRAISQDDATVEANVKYLVKLLRLFNIHDGERY